ncbi:MAG: leucine-rich repeat domain-containing protein [Paludibacteraceae bacterium]|nr:leucine-rich repeat domain-containing protein [Paludibacteraceae bacterium]
MKVPTLVFTILLSLASAFNVYAGEHSFQNRPEGFYRNEKNNSLNLVVKGNSVYLCNFQGGRSRFCRGKFVPDRENKYTIACDSISTEWTSVEKEIFTLQGGHLDRFQIGAVSFIGDSIENYHRQDSIPSEILDTLDWMENLYSSSGSLEKRTGWTFPRKFIKGLWLETYPKEPLCEIYDYEMGYSSSRPIDYGVADSFYPDMDTLDIDIIKLICTPTKVNFVLTNSWNHSLHHDSLVCKTMHVTNGFYKNFYQNKGDDEHLYKLYYIEGYATRVKPHCAISELELFGLTSRASDVYIFDSVTCFKRMALPKNFDFEKRERNTICIDGIIYNFTNYGEKHFCVTAISDSVIKPFIRSEISYNDTVYPVSEVNIEYYSGHNVRNLHLPSSIKKVSSLKSFSLEQLYLSDSINTVMGIDCPRLYAIHSPLANPFFTSVDGILYNKNKTSLVRFPANKKLTAFTLPKTVKTIKQEAFACVYGLKKINLNACEYIEYDAFRSCVNLSKIKMPTYTDEDMVLDLGQNVFNGCNSLKSLNFKCNVSAYNSIDDLENLEHLVFEKDVDLESPTYCPNLKSIKVKKSDDYYTIDGVLYEKYDNENTLLCYPSNKSEKTFVIPDSVAEIDTKAFEYNKHLEKLVLPNKATASWFFITGCPKLQAIENLDKTKIDRLLKIQYCPSLKMITLPDSLKELSVRGCDSLMIQIKNNPYFKLVDSVLYSEDMKTLIYYPPIKKDTVFVVPSSVREIKSFAICNANNLREILFHDSIQSFDGGHVSNCKNLRRYRISANQYEKHMPFGCPNLDSASLSIIYQRYAVVDGVLFTKDTTQLISYPKDKKDTVYSIPPSVTVIQPCAFIENTCLKSVIIPASVKKMVSIHNNSDIDNYIECLNFIGCSALKSITVSSDNNHFRSIDGVLYSKDGKELICYPANKADANFQIPPSVTTIASHAFYDNHHIKELTIPSSVFFIGDSVFSGRQLHLIMEGEMPPYICSQKFDGSYSVKIKKAKALYRKSPVWSKIKMK